METLKVQSIRGYVVSGVERVEGTSLELEPYGKQTRGVERRVSRADGTFEFLNVQPGRYILRTSLPGFDSLATLVRVEPPPKWPSRRPYLKLDLSIQTLSCSHSRASLATSIPRIKSGGEKR